MEIREVNINERYWIFYCPECEEKYGFKVEVWLKFSTPYHPRKHTRVQEFFDAHENCFVPIWERGFKEVETLKEESVATTSPLSHPVIKQAMEIFDVKDAKVYPIMEERH